MSLFMASPITSSLLFIHRKTEGCLVLIQVLSRGPSDIILKLQTTQEQHHQPSATPERPIIRCACLHSLDSDNHERGNMNSILSSLKSLPPLADFLLPTPEAYSLLLTGFQYFPVVSPRHHTDTANTNQLTIQFTILQWLVSYHPAGKTSLLTSPFNIPGRLAWCLMEIIGPVNLAYILYRTPAQLNIASLPASNKTVATAYILHYINRGFISPWFSAPSMSPIHASIAVSAMAFNWFNSVCLAGWLLGYEVPVTQGFKTDGAAAGPAGKLSAFIHGHPSSPATTQIVPVVGLALFVVGMAGNIYSERTLFRLRREEADTRAEKDKAKSKSSGSDGGNRYSKVYVLPPARGVFRTILFPHYAFEWLEWLGFAMLGTAVFPSRQANITSTHATPVMSLAPWLVPVARWTEAAGLPLPLPAVVFLVNAVANMWPHASWGRKWYVEKFGKERVGWRGSVVPFLPWL